VINAEPKFVIFVVPNIFPYNAARVIVSLQNVCVEIFFEKREVSLLELSSTQHKILHDADKGCIKMHSFQLRGSSGVILVKKLHRRLIVTPGEKTNFKAILTTRKLKVGCYTVKTTKISFSLHNN